MEKSKIKLCPANKIKKHSYPTNNVKAFCKAKTTTKKKHPLIYIYITYKNIIESNRLKLLRGCIAVASLPKLHPLRYSSCLACP